MKIDERFETSGLPEAQYEPGSTGQVLENRLGITSKPEMNVAELRALERAMDTFIRMYDDQHRFTVEDLCTCHRIWLGEIYEWAGHYRQVNVSRDNFLFAAAAHIPSLMDHYEREVLGRWTPCRVSAREDIARAMAETHVELVLIRPFRDGNGRLARIVSTLMALQAGLPLLDYRLLAEGGEKAYLGAIHAGMDKQYGPMQTLFEEVIEQSLSAVSLSGHTSHPA